MSKRTLTERLRNLADEAWEEGEKDISTNLHALARELENPRKLTRLTVVPVPRTR